MEKQQNIIIIGAGFAGIGMGIQLKQLGEHSFTILERAGQVGGTWRDNTYPGAACDVPSHLYSYSFEPYPEWTRMFAPQKEILDYMELCVEKYQLNAHIKFNQSVIEVRFNEETGHWTVKTSTGESYTAKFMIGATGPLNKVSIPDIPGIGSFQGKLMHSAEWDHSYSVKDKKVAVIGTGASAIQVVPGISQDVKELKLFQRTPSWVMPRPDRAISDDERAKFRKNPAAQMWQRLRIYWILEVRAFGFVKAPGLMKYAEKMVRSYLEKKVPDPELREKITPKYTMGCKRVLLSNNYYPALCEDHVEVITDPISSINETGFITQSGRKVEVDAIVCATGFIASESMSPFPIIGRNGVDLVDLWAKGGEAYLGTTISGFPNAFIIVGPNTGLGHNSIIHIIESQITYILGALKAVKEKGAKWVDVKQEVQDAYNLKVQKRLAGTVWNVGGCMSWYLNSEGKNTTLWPGFTFEFRRKTKRFRLKDYEVQT